MALGIRSVLVDHLSTGLRGKVGICEIHWLSETCPVDMQNMMFFRSSFETSLKHKVSTSTDLETCPAGTACILFCRKQRRFHEDKSNMNIGQAEKYTCPGERNGVKMLPAPFLASDDAYLRASGACGLQCCPVCPFPRKAC